MIHDTHEDFVKAASRYSYHAPSGHYDSAVGAFHPVDHREKYDKKKKRWINTTPKHYAGVIRLEKEWVVPDVIVHEVVHAAAHIWRLDISKRVNLGDNCYQNEEYFAYIVGDLADQVMSKLTKNRLIR